MGLADGGCVAELLVQGWIMTRAAVDGMIDVACPHYHARFWEGGHVGCGCELEGGQSPGFA